MFEFKINNQTLDIGDNTAWEQVKTNARYNVQELEIAYTIPVDLPCTPNNNRILERANDILSSGAQSFKGEIWFNGTFKYAATLVVLRATRIGYSCSFYAGENSLELLDKGLREIPWPLVSRAALQLTHNPDHNADNAVEDFFCLPTSKIDGQALFKPNFYPFPHFNQYNFETGEYATVKMPLPYVFWKNIIAYYLNYHGYKLGGNFFESEPGKRFCFASNYILDGGSYAQGADGTMRGKVQADEDETNDVVHRIPATSVLDPLEAFDNNTLTYTIPFAGRYEMQIKDLQIKVDKITGIGAQYFEHYLGVVVAGVDKLLIFNGQTVDNNGRNEFYTSQKHVVDIPEEDVGKTIYFYYQCVGQNTNHTVRPNNPYNIEIKAFPQDRTTEENNPDFTVAEFLPDVKFGDLITQLQQLPGLSVQFNAIEKSLEINYTPLSNFKPREKDYTNFVGREFEITIPEQSGYKVGYAYPEDFVNPIPFTPNIKVAVLDEFEIASVIDGLKANDAIYLRGTNQIAIITDDDGNFTIYDDTRFFEVGNKENEILVDMYPVKMQAYISNLFLPWPQHEQWRSEFNRDDYTTFIPQLCFYYGLDGKGDPDDNLNFFPYASPYNYDALGNKLQDFNLWIFDAEGLKDLHLQFIYVNPADTTQIVYYALLPEQEALDLNESDTIYINGSAFFIKEVITPYTSKGIGAIKLTLVKKYGNRVS